MISNQTFSPWLHHKIAIILFALLFSIHGVSAQAGFLDLSFGTDSVNCFDYPGHFTWGEGFAQQKDGKLIITGSISDTAQQFKQSMMLCRLTRDGRIDSSFVDNGWLPLKNLNYVDGVIHKVMIQDDDKIIISGREGGMPIANSLIARFTKDGAPDPEFGTGGYVQTFYSGIVYEANALAIQTDGKILVGGTLFDTLNNANNFFLIRYLSNGHIDSTFGQHGTVFTLTPGTAAHLTDIKLLPDGRILAIGEWAGAIKVGSFLVKYLPDGRIDSTFRENGVIDFAPLILFSILLDKDGSIILGGRAWQGLSIIRGFSVLKLTPEGIVDTGFNHGKRVDLRFDSTYYPISNQLLIQPDGKILAIGVPDNSLGGFLVARLKRNGELDQSFGARGFAITPYKDRLWTFPNTGALMQVGGKLVVMAKTIDVIFPKFCLSRYFLDINWQDTMYTDGNGGNGGVPVDSLAPVLRLYPNPATDKATLEYSLEADMTVSIDLFDCSGRLLRSLLRESPQNKGLHQESLQFGPDLTSGLYLIRLRRGDRTDFMKWVRIY